MADEVAKEKREFQTKRIFVKDFSFELPGGANTFMNPWDPDVNVDLGVTQDQLDDDIYEVVLTLTVAVSNADSTAFMVEILQAGIFSCSGYTKDDTHRILHTVCPNLLFPYAREAVDNMTLKGSFPALMLEPVNFDAIYAQEMQADANKSEEADN